MERLSGEVSATETEAMTRKIALFDFPGVSIEPSRPVFSE